MPVFIILKKSCFGDNNNNNNKIIYKCINKLISFNGNSVQYILSNNNNNNNNNKINTNKKFVLIKNNNYNNDNIINKHFNNIILIIKSLPLIIIIYNKVTKMTLNFCLNNYDRLFFILNNNNNNKCKNKMNNNNLHDYKNLCNVSCNCNHNNIEQYFFDNMFYCRKKQYIINNSNNNNNNNYINNNIKNNVNNNINNNIKKANCDLKNYHKLYQSDNFDIIKKHLNNDNNVINKNKNFLNKNNIVKNFYNINILKTFKQKKSLHLSLVFILILLQFIPTFVYGHNNDNNNFNNNNNNQTIQELYTTSFQSTSSSSSTATATSLLDQTNRLDTTNIASFITRENTIRREPNLSYTTSGCHSCQLREQVKADNLASIKRHILLRLELKTLPNITSPIVPREIIEKFYKNHSIFNQNKSGDTKYNLNNNNNNSNNNRDKLGRRPINLPSYDSMQGDDPRTYIDYGSDENDNEDYEEEFFSIVNSLYIFPTMPRMRHNRKSDILHFSFTNNGYSSVSQAILHIYIRGRDWIYDHERSLLNNSDNISTNRQDIIITINRVLRRQNSQNSTHTQKVSELRQPIPNGMGKWVAVDVTDMVTNWFNNPNTNHGIVVKTLEQWMKPLVVSDDNPNNKAYALYIEILTKDNRKRRTKRNTSLNCSESDNEERCCRYPLEVDFRKFNWDWIVAPTSFNAYFCNGECKLGFLPKYPHTHIMQLSTAPQPCCSPTKMSAISLLYFNNDRNLVMSTIPNMAVDKCSCS